MTMCRCKASSPPSSSRRRLSVNGSSNHRFKFNAALTASCFADREAFLSRPCWMKRRSASLNSKARRWKTSSSRPRRFRCRQSQQLQAHPGTAPRGAGNRCRKRFRRSYISWRNSFGTTPRIRGDRQQLKQDADNRSPQQALMQQIEEAARQADDWGYLNALINQHRR